MRYLGRSLRPYHGISRTALSLSYLAAHLYPTIINLPTIPKASADLTHNDMNYIKNVNNLNIHPSEGTP